MSDVEPETVSDHRGAKGYPRNYWYAAYAAQRLADKPVAVRLLGWDLVLYRDAEGRACALHDRCAHRGAQLSLGEITEGRIACRYHGWRYDSDGRCAHVPSLVADQQIPRGFAVRAFPCAEQDGYIWIWAGEGAPSPPQPPEIADFARLNWAQGVVALACPALAVIENNLDWCHPIFAHPYTHGQFFMNQAMGFRDQGVELRLTEQGLTVSGPVAGDADAPAPEAPATTLAFELPDRVTVSFAGGPQGPMRIVMHMVPTGPSSCRQEWMISTGPVTEDASQSVVWTDAPQAIFEQDRQVLESLQRAVDSEGHAFERSVEADAPTLLARKVYALAAQARWAQARAGLVQRRIVRLRS